MRKLSYVLILLVALCIACNPNEGGETQASQEGGEGGQLTSSDEDGNSFQEYIGRAYTVEQYLDLKQLLMDVLGGQEVTNPKRAPSGGWQEPNPITQAHLKWYFALEQGQGALGVPWSIMIWRNLQTGSYEAHEICLRTINSDQSRDYRCRDLDPGENLELLNLLEQNGLLLDDTYKLVPENPDEFVEPPDSPRYRLAAGWEGVNYHGPWRYFIEKDGDYTAAEQEVIDYVMDLKSELEQLEIDETVQSGEPRDGQ